MRLRVRLSASLRRYLPALAILAVGMIFHASSIRMLGRGVEATFFVYMLAMLVGAWRGYGPGLLVTTLVIVVLPFLFNPAFTVASINLVGLACLTLMSLFVSRTAAAERRARQALRELNRDLERRVEEKTRDLEGALEREQTAHAAAADANRLKDEFLATISHELRGPLQGVVGFTQLLASGSLSEAQSHAALQAIARNSTSLASLVDDIFDVSRITTGKLTLDIAPVELKLVADAALQNVRASAERKDITLTFDMDADLKSIPADANRLQQAIWNILSNAVKFTPRGGHVRMTIRRDEGFARIEVVDSGAGIAPDFLPFVFDRFRQAEPSTTRVHQGLGLGLSIVRHIVESHGGTVAAGSYGPGRGAAFTIRVPLVASITPSQRRESPAAAGTEPILSRDRRLDGVAVLVLDDHGDSREVLSLSLRHVGAGVETADSVPAAIERIRHRRPDVLVSDLAMPGEDGFSLLKKLRELDLGGVIPVIAVSGFASEADRARTLAAGFAAHFSKPVDVDRLAATIGELARGSSRVLDVGT